MIPCPHCGTSAPLAFRTHDHNLRVSDVTFDYYRCPTCRLVFLHPVPANLSDYYASDYFVYAKPTTLAELEDFLRYQEDTKIKQITAHKSSGALLDIGAGYGGFAFRAKTAGFAVEAIEMNADACRFLTEVVGINAHHSADPITTLAGLGQYNMITLWHVIEHLAQPFALLDTIADHLAPGGMAVIASPNPQSFQFSLFRARWKAVDAPRHVQLIPAALIEARLQGRGLVTVSMDSRDANSQLEDYTYWHEQFTGRLTNPTLKRMARAVSGVAHTLVKPLEQRGFRGSSYTLMFRKPS